MRALCAEPGNASARLKLVLAILNSRGRIAFMFMFVIIFVFSMVAILLVGLLLEVVVLTCARAGARGGASKTCASRDL